MFLLDLVFELKVLQSNGHNALTVSVDCNAAISSTSAPVLPAVALDLHNQATFVRELDKHSYSASHSIGRAYPMRKRPLVRGKMVKQFVVPCSPALNVPLHDNQMSVLTARGMLPAHVPLA